MSRSRLLAEVGRFVRSNLSAAVASALEWVLVTALVLAGAHYLLAAAAGALTGAAIDFSLKRQWAFRREQPGVVSSEGLRYLLVSSASLLLNVTAAWALVGRAGLPPVPGVIAASVLVGVAWNYPLHRHFVFRHPPGPPTAGRPSTPHSRPAA